MDDGVGRVERGEQGVHLPGGMPVPQAVTGGSQAVGIAPHVVLLQTDDAQPRDVDQVVGHRPDGREQHNVVAMGGQALGALEGDARRAAVDVGEVRGDDQGHGVSSLGLALVHHRRVGGLEAIDRGFGLEFGFDPRPVMPAHRPLQVGRRQDLDEGHRQRIDVPWRHQPSAVVADQMRNTAGARRDHRHPAGHRFQDAGGERLAVRRQAVHRVFAHHVGDAHCGRRAPAAGPADPAWQRATLRHPPGRRRCRR